MSFDAMLDDNDDIHTVIASIGERLTGSIVTIGGEIADLHAGNGHSEPLMIIFRTDAENRQARIAERCGSIIAIPRGQQMAGCQRRLGAITEMNPNYYAIE